MLKLKNKVPINCTTDAVQSILLGSHVNSLNSSSKFSVLGILMALTVSMYRKNAAVVKNIEPTKKVTESMYPPAQLMYGGRAPRAKNEAPIANNTPIHHAIALGAH